MSDEKFVSIQKFADLAGVSRQTVYNKLTNDLQKYVKLVKGKKAINTSALKLYSVNKNENYCKNDVNEKSNRANDLYNVLQEQLKVKDDQIESLEAQLSMKDLQIAEMNERLKETIKLNENNQVLLLGKRTQQQIVEVIKEEPIKKSFWQRLIRK